MLSYDSGDVLVGSQDNGKLTISQNGSHFIAGVAGGNDWLDMTNVAVG